MALAKLTVEARKEAMRLSRFDLNLLVVFEALMRERSVSRAARHLALSQPATSNALNRLRALMDDRLFVPTPAGMEPTPRALQLADPIRRALEDIRNTLEPESFNPAMAEREFTLAMNNHAALVLAPALTVACEREAPGVRLHIRPSGTLPIADMLDRGELDFAITAHVLPKQRFSSLRLMEDDYLIVMRAGHPQAGRAITLEVFAGMKRLEVLSSGENMAFVEAAFASAGLSVPTLSGVPYLSLGETLRTTDHVAIVRRQIAEMMEKSGSFTTLALPFPTPPVGCILHWHHRHTGHLAHMWLSGLIRQTAGQIGSHAVRASVGQ